MWYQHLTDRTVIIDTIIQWRHRTAYTYHYKVAPLHRLHRETTKAFFFLTIAFVTNLNVNVPHLYSYLIVYMIPRILKTHPGANVTYDDSWSTSTSQQKKVRQVNTYYTNIHFAVWYKWYYITGFHNNCFLSLIIKPQFVCQLSI